MLRAGSLSAVTLLTLLAATQDPVTSQRACAPSSASALMRALIRNRDVVHSYQFDYSLASVHMDRSGVHKIAATLRNLSTTNVTFNLESASASLMAGLHIWRKGMAGSYMLDIDPNIHISPEPPIPFTLEVGKSVTIEWPPTSEPGADKDFGLVLCKRYAGIETGSRSLTLEPAEYTVDGGFELDLYSGTPFTEMIGSINTFSSAKIWVTVP